MGKRFVVRNIVAVAVLGVVLVFSSCQKDEKKIIGTWKYESVEIRDFACSNPMMTIALRSLAQSALENYLSFSDSEIEFTKEGEAKYRSTGNTASYRVSDGRLIVTNNTINAYDLSFPDKKTMQWEQNLERYYLEMMSEFVAEIIGYELEITKCSYREILKKQ